MFVESAQHSDTLLLTQPSHAGVIISHRFAHHFALRFGEAPGSVLKLGDRVFVQRESDLHHTKAILPYWRLPGEREIMSREITDHV